MLRKVAIIGLIVMASLPARAGLPETPRLRQLTTADGLPSNVVHALAEDLNGYLWIGTGDGLARYDGANFRIWRREDGLPGNEVSSLHVDADDRLWIGTVDGLAMFDAERREFRHYTAGNTPEMASNIVWSMAGTGDGALWFGTGNAGLYRLDAEGRMTRFMPDPDDPASLPSPSVPLLEVAVDGTLWVGTRGGVVRWTGAGFEPLPGFPADPVLLGLSTDGDGRLWIGLQQGVGVFDPGEGFSRDIPWAADLEGGPVYNLLLQDRGGLYWLRTRDGLAVGGPEGARTVKTYSELRQGAVKPDWELAHEDREGGLWLASTDSGLWYLAPNWRQFSVLMHRDGDPGSLGNLDVTGIAPASDGAMWLVGNSGVLDLLDPETGRVRHVYRDDEDYVPTHVLEDDRGAVWIGFHAGLARLDRDSGRMRFWRADDEEQAALPGERVALVQAGDGLVWTVSNYWGLQARDRDGLVREALLPGEGRGLDEEIMLAFAGVAPDGGLWLAGQGGLLMWNAGTRALEPVPGIAGGHIVAFALQGRDRVWIARQDTLESYRWDGAELSLQARFGADEGLPAVDFRGLGVDAAGIVWITTARGLVRVDPEARRADVFGVSRGLPAQEMLTPPVARRFDGRLHVSTTAGLVIFDPAQLRPDDGAPVLGIVAVETRGRGGTRELDPRHPLRLSRSDYELRVLARLHGFHTARQNIYRFRLHGYDEGWVDTGAAGERVFPALSPGRYRLDVVGRTPLSTWSEPVALEFEVAAPWWWTGSARAGYALAALLLGWWCVHLLRHRLRTRLAWQRVQQERELARQASEAKTRFLATLGHEVRTPMTGVLGMSELLLQTPLDERQRGYTESIRRAGEHLMRLVNDALDLARIEAGKLELDLQPFGPARLIDEVGALMAPLARQRGLEYRIDVDAAMPAALRGDVVRIRQILLNLLGNAIKFTERGHVALQVRPLAPSGLRLTVSDSGPGLNSEQRQRLFRRFEQAEGARTSSRYGGSGLGLAICQELAAAMGGKIEVESLQGRGTRFEVELPLPIADPVPVADPVPAPAPAGGRVLLVEDDPTVASVITGLLEAGGYAATHAGHGLAALAELAEGEFDVALVDLDLPGIDGVTLARQLRGQGYARPMIAITARADSAAEPAAAAAGFDAFLRKPVAGAALVAAIEDVRRQDLPEAGTATG